MLENLTPDQINNLISAGSGLLGAAIGAGATLLSTWLASKMQKSGKLKLYIKNVGSEEGNGITCGYYTMWKSELTMRLPIWLDVCNTSGITRIVRNVSMHAYSQKKEVAEFLQIDAFGDGKKIKLGDNGAYTLVIPENSARRVALEFMLNEKNLPADSKEFDELILTYFDEKNKIHAFHFIDVEKCWVEGPIKVSRQWITLDRRCKYAR